jgi:hypothetical protein
VSDIEGASDGATPADEPQPANQPASPPPARPAGARCAVHPEVIARSTPCERCGNFACEPCFDDPASEICASCRDRTGAGRVAWEDRSKGWLERLTGTLSPAWLEPRSTFRNIGHGELGPALTFFMTTLGIGYAPMILCLPLIGVGMWAVLAERSAELGELAELGPVMVVAWAVMLPLWVTAVHGLAVLYYLVVFHLTARLLGGQGSIGGSLRGVLYTGAVHPVNALVTVFAFVPLVGPLFNLLMQLVKLVWSGFALAGTAEGVHRLEGERALLAGHLPGALAILLFIGFFVVIFGIVFSQFGRL